MILLMIFQIWKASICSFKYQIQYQFYSLLMDNPQLSNCDLTPRTIYSYDNHTNIPWNITEYQVPALHNDYKKITQERVYASQKKGVKTNDFYVTKRGFYMDYQLKVAKDIPSSAVHQQQKPWESPQLKLEGELLDKARSSIKYSIYDRMQMRQKRHPVPAVSTYSLEKSLEDIQKLLEKNKPKKISIGQKRYFHMDTTFLADKVPGMGFYNPHDEIQQLHKSVGDWKTWTKKHQNWNKVLQKREAKIPAPGTYTPISQQFRSFSSIERIEKKSIKNGFGSDARFPYVRPNKKMIKQMRPAPCSYETKIEWRGKKTSPQKKQWFKLLWKGSPSKVYA